MKNKLLIINILWAAAVVGAFAIGQSLKSSSTATDAADSNAAGGPNGIANPLGGSGSGSKEMASSGEKVAVSAKLADWIGQQPTWLIKETLSDAEMERAISDLILEGDPVKRNLQFSMLMMKLTPENAQVAFTTLREKATGWDMRRNMGMLAYAWGTIDAQNALDSFGELGGREMGWMRGAAVSGWATSSPQEAIDWVAGIEDERQRSEFSWGLVSGLARSDISQAPAYVEALSEDRNRDRLVGMIADQKMKEGVDSATSWAQTLGDDEMKGGALDNIARTLANRDPEAAAEWAEQFAGDDYARRAVGEVAEELAEKDVSTAVNWIENLPEGASRASAYGEVYWEWAREDPEAASTSLLDMAASPSKDRAIVSLSRAIANDDPQGAIQWASTIQDEELRIENLVRSGQAFYRQSPEEAVAWAAQALPETEQAKIKESTQVL